MKHTQGFTLPELLVTLILMLILATLAIPSFQKIMHQKQQDVYLHALQQTLEFSHLYAIEHHVTVTICPSLDGTTCDDNAHWDQAGIVFTAHKILRAFSAPPLSQTVTVSLFPDQRWVRFQPEGLGVQTSGNFTLTDNKTHKETQLILSNAGRMRIMPLNS